MGDVTINPGDPPQSTEPTPAANPFEGKSPEEIQAMFQAEQTAKAAAEEEAKKMNEAYTNLAVSALQSQQAPARQEVVKETPLPDPDDDPAAYQQALIDRRVAEQVQAQVAPLVQIYQQDRPVTLQSAVDNQRMAMRQDASKFPGFAEMENDILQFAAQYPLEQRAKPGALEQCYWRVLGQKTAVERAAEARRQAAAMEGAGRSPGNYEQSPADRSFEQLKPAEQKGVALGGFHDPKEYSTFQGPGRMTIDEFNAAKAEAATKKGAP